LYASIAQSAGEKDWNLGTAIYTTGVMVVGAAAIAWGGDAWKWFEPRATRVAGWLWHLQGVPGMIVRSLFLALVCMLVVLFIGGEIWSVFYCAANPDSASACS
jgi:hypothetical protein